MTPSASSRTDPRSTARRSLPRTLTLCLWGLIAWTAALPVAAQSGHHDPSFAGTGEIQFPIDLVAGGDDFASDVELHHGQTGGPIILVTAQDAGGDRDCVVTRYDAFGALDTSFGTNGRTQFSLSPGADLDDSCEALAVHENGHIVVVGTTYDAQGTPTASLAQLTMDGQLDPSFGVGGRAAFAGSVDESSFFDVTFDSHDHLLAVGSWRSASWMAGDTDVLIARLYPDGYPDLSFGQNGGWSSTWFDLGQSARGDVGLQVATDAYERIWIGGRAQTDSGERLAVVRWSFTGTSTGAFSKGTFDFGTGAAAGARFAGLNVDSSNRVLLAGTELGPTLAVGALRLTSTGTVDTSYGTGGVTLWAWGSNGDGVAHAATLDPLDRLLVVGTRGGDSVLAATRLTAAGHVDLGFGNQWGSFEHPVAGTSGQLFEPSVTTDAGNDRATLVGTFVTGPTSDMDVFALRLLP